MVTPGLLDSIVCQLQVTGFKMCLRQPYKIQEHGYSRL